MRRVVKPNRLWSSIDIAVLTEMVSRGDLLIEATDTLDRSPNELRQKIQELRLLATPCSDLRNRAA